MIIPIFNAAAFLEEAVQSALQQQEVAELILVEDGSSDASFQLAEQLEKSDPRIQLFQHPDRQNHGAGASRNLGIRKANSPFLAFLDADDFYLKNRFKNCPDFFARHPNALGLYEAVGSQFQTPDAEKFFLDNIRGKGLTSLEEPVAPDQLFEVLLRGQKGWWHLNGFTIRKKLIEQIGFFDEQLRMAQDSDFNLRSSLSRQIYPGSLTVPVALRRVHSNNRILNREKAIHYKRLFYAKWFKKMLKAKWSVPSNRFLLSTHLSYHPWVNRQKQNWSRRLVKIILAPIYLIRYPLLFRKLF